MVTVHPIETVVSDPNIRHGQAIIAGRDVRVIDVVASHLYRGLPPEELATNFALDMGQVYAALAYYYQNKSELDRQLRQEVTAAQRWADQLDAQGKLTRLD